MTLDRDSVTPTGSTGRSKLPMTLNRDNVTPTPRTLHEACMEGNISEIKELLQAGAGPNEFNEAGRTPLHLAIMSGRPDVYTLVETLIAHGANVNLVCEPEEESPLHLTLKHVPAEMAELVALRLIQNGADAEHRDRSLRNSYDYAVGHSYMQVVRVVEDAVPVHEAVHKLLDQRVEIDARQLILAIQQGRLDDIHRCLARGASVNYIDPNGAAAIHYLIAKSPINKPPVLLLLLDAKADVNLRTYEGDNALNLAIKSDNFRDIDERREVIEILLRNGCSVASKDLDGKDAVTLASERGYHDVMDRMDDIYPSKEIQLETIPIDRFSFVFLGYYDYWESLRRRVLGDGVIDLTEFVENARIDMNVADEEGRMCLHWAVLRESTEHLIEIMKLLLEHGANMDAVSKRDGTPLHLAAETGNLLAVKALLSLGADDLSKDGEGKTVLAKAMTKDHAEIRKVLTLHKQKRNSSVYANTAEIENNNDKKVNENDIPVATEQKPSQETPVQQENGERPTSQGKKKKPKNKSAMCILT